MPKKSLMLVHAAYSEKADTCVLISISARCNYYKFVCTEQEIMQVTLHTSEI